MQGFEKAVLGSRAWGAVSRRFIVPWLSDFARFPSRADVLEVGTGGGFNAQALLARFPGWRLVATDYDPDMVERATGRLGPFRSRVTVEQADATSLPYPEARFDIVIAIGVWHHVGVWEKATSEAGRVLRPKGRLVLADLLSGFFRGPNRSLFPPERPYPLDDLRSALAESGFDRWRVRATRDLWYRLVAEKAA
jgi:SAM-dependent methyltransferase